MKVKDLISLLKDLNQEADVVIHRDVLNYGIGKLDRIVTGLFEITDYGNDFISDQALIVHPAQVRAICLFPEDYVVEPLKLNKDKDNG